MAARKKLTKAERAAQTMALFSGTWRLSAYATQDAKIPMLPHHSVGASVSTALCGTTDDLLSATAAASGLTIIITPDQTFAETVDDGAGEVAIPWATVDGVLSAHAVPFSGVVIVPPVGKAWACLRPSMTAPWLPPISKDGPSLRYNDGDTKVYDRLTMRDDRMLRSVHVATDDATLRRIALLYVRAKGTNEP
jgi:hypothetical protein